VCVCVCMGVCVGVCVCVCVVCARACVRVCACMRGVRVCVRGIAYIERVTFVTMLIQMGFMTATRTLHTIR
jgi:hypothetical protein